MKEVWACFREGLALLSSRGRQILYTYGFVLVLLAGLDGVALYYVSKVFAAGANSSTTLEISSGGSTLALVIGLFVLKTVLSTAISWVVVNQFAREELRLGSVNYKKIMNASWTSRIDGQVTDLYNGVDRGPFGMVQGLLVNVVTIAAEAMTAALILGALMTLQPQTAIIASVYFVLVAIFQHKLLSVSSARAGEVVVAETNNVYRLLNDSFHLGKLLSINKSQSLIPSVDRARDSLALARGRVAFLGMLPRYFMELILAVGLGVIAGITYAISGTQGAVSALTVFAAAGFRLLPIVNRIQGLILQLFSTLPAARLVLVETTPESHVRPVSTGMDDLVTVQNVSFQYPSSTSPVLSEIDLSFKRGLQYAIVGPSGAGKTTLVDMCLGLLHPSTGEISVQSNLKIAYVPQETYIARIPLLENIALEWDSKFIDSNHASAIARIAHIENVLQGRDGDIELATTSLSGGQKQRIGLARALYRNPDLLFLDEVTSALDAETEHAVMESVQSLRGKATVVIVAHRLSTVQHADQVIYMDSGKVLGVGTFDELRRTIPSLQRQIELGTLDLLD
jgi:ABC-type multidrug transport system fused ATPase/permease subunit